MMNITAEASNPFQLNLTRSLVSAEPVAICQCLQGLTWRQVLSTILYFTRYSSTSKDTWGFNISGLERVCVMDFIRYYKSLNEKSSLAVSNKLREATQHYPINVDCWSVRRKSLCRGHNCLFLDYDNTGLFVSGLQEKLIDFMNTHRLNYIMYSTFSGAGKFRLLIPMNNIVSYNTYKQCISIFLYILGPLSSGLDLTSFDSSRFFYLPNFQQTKEEAESGRFIRHRFDGVYLSTELLTKLSMLYQLSGVFVPSLKWIKKRKKV